MGILKNILNLFKKDDTKMLNSGIFDANSIEQGLKIQIWDYNNKVKNIKYQDNKITQLILAKILKYKESDAKLIDAYNYVTFEIPQGLQVTEQILQKVASEYDYITKQNINDYCMYLGSIDLTPDKGLQFVSRNDGVQSYIDRKLKPKLLEERNKTNQKNNSINSKAQFMEQIDVREKVNAINIQRKQRLENPYLKFKSKYMSQDGNIYSDYEGINTTNGDILNINALRKIGKTKIPETGLNSYLYTAIVSSTNDSNNAQIFDPYTNKYAGNYICFELPNDLERMLPYMNKQNLTDLLNMLSKGASIEPNYDLTYVGAMDGYGNVDYNQIPKSQDVQTAIKNLEETYKRENLENRTYYGQDEGRN